MKCLPSEKKMIQRKPNFNKTLIQNAYPLRHFGLSWLHMFQANGWLLWNLVGCLRMNTARTSWRRHGVQNVWRSKRIKIPSAAQVPSSGHFPQRWALADRLLVFNAQSATNSQQGETEVTKSQAKSASRCCGDSQCKQSTKQQKQTNKQKPELRRTFY